MMARKLYLLPEIEKLCEKVGIDPRDVARIDLWPGSATFLVYERSEAGLMLSHDGYAVMTQRAFPLTQVERRK